MRRWLTLSMAVLGLLLGGVHSVASASANAPTTSNAASAECPQHAAQQAKKAAEKPSCCADGCGSQCMPAATLLGTAPAKFLAFLRSVIESEAIAAPAHTRPDQRDRPPRSAA